jgi:hypothetical protein
MNLKPVVVQLLIVLMAAPSLTAQQRQEPPEVWRAYVEKLEAGAFVRVRLTDGTSVKGHFIQATSDAFRVKPKTRIPVAIRGVAFTDIESIERQKEGKSPGAKVLIGVGVGAASFLTFALIAFAAWSGGY